jgi:hypothetical protein
MNLVVREISTANSLSKYFVPYGCTTSQTELHVLSLSRLTNYSSIPSCVYLFEFKLATINDQAAIDGRKHQLPATWSWVFGMQP